MEKNKNEKVQVKKKTNPDDSLPAKTPRLPAEGSRYGALILLLVCILFSIGFYIWGKIHRGELMFDFGGSTNRWEYKK